MTDAELWIVGHAARWSMAPLRALARRERVRFVSRFVDDVELPAYFRRADLVVLPYRDADQSGVLYTALAFGKPIVCSRVGGFGEVAGAAPREWCRRATERRWPRRSASCSATPPRAPSWPPRRRRAAAGPYSWDAVAERTLALYRELLDR